MVAELQSFGVLFGVYREMRVMLAIAVVGAVDMWVGPQSYPHIHRPVAGVARRWR